LTCIWQLRVPSCYGVFQDEKALLKHMLAVHVRDNGSAAGMEVDWPADYRRGNIEKCGYSVRINGEQMLESGGNLVVRTHRRITAGSVSSLPTRSPAVSSARSSATALTVDVGSIANNSPWVTVVEMNPSAETGERFEMPSDERFEMFGDPSNERFEMFA